MPSRIVSFSTAADPNTPSADFPGRAVRVAHVLVKDADLADAVEAGVRDGTPIAELAAEHSTCPSAARGGDLGWVARGATVPEFEAAAFATSVMGVARCQTEYGLHVLQVLEERAGAVGVAQLGVLDLKALLDARAAGPGDEPLQLIDVREPHEEATAALPGFQLLPLSQFDEWAPSVATRLDPHAHTIVLCHHGVRSQRAAQFLTAQAGFTRVSNVAGGIDAYARLADRGVPLY